MSYFNIVAETSENTVVELKRRGVQIREAFNQINRYKRDSFWAGSGLFEYVQIFVISNGTNTKYYSNSTRDNAIRDAKAGNTKRGKTSNSFEFTCFWADANNRVIPDLVDFTKTFFAKHTLLNILTKYCIFTSENTLMVMRPYQITATERILNRIEIANNYKKYGSVAGGGYIWHTTGSGKTLTSFKTARLASQLSYIDKVLFVVDRKDLDYQTMKEYDRFEKGAANSNSSTRILKRQLEDNNAHIIITTIQKLATFIKKNPGHEVYDKHVVIIFDECHRSQFGDMHTAIVKNFKRYHLFGFTGTPIFSVNSGKAKNPEFFTTAQTFGDQLHAYTIVDAINDNNVLPFRVDYIKTMDVDEEITDEMVWDINREKAMMAPKRIELVTKYILDHFDQKTYRGDKTYIYNTDITDDIVFEVELIKQIEINIDYILMLVKKYHDTHCEDKEVLITIKRAVEASPELRSKKALIESFIAGINDVEDVMAEWREFVVEQRENDLAQLISEERLNPENTRRYIENAFRDGEIRTAGTDIDKLMPPVSRFGGSGRDKKKQAVIEKLKQFFEKYYGVGGAMSIGGTQKVVYGESRGEIGMVAEEKNNKYDVSK